MNNIELFSCYSVPLMRFLSETKKIKYKIVGLHPKTKNTFWVYIRDEELNNALTEWSK